MNPPELIFPLDLENGVQEILNDEIQGTEINVAFEPNWNPVGLFGSPIFDSHLNHDSRISLSLIHI